MLLVKLVLSSSILAVFEVISLANVFLSVNVNFPHFRPLRNARCQVARLWSSQIGQNNTATLVRSGYNFGHACCGRFSPWTVLLSVVNHGKPNQYIYIIHHPFAKIDFLGGLRPIRQINCRYWSTIELNTHLWYGGYGKAWALRSCVAPLGLTVGPCQVDQCPGRGGYKFRSQGSGLARTAARPVASQCAWSDHDGVAPKMGITTPNGNFQWECIWENDGRWSIGF